MDIDKKISLLEGNNSTNKLLSTQKPSTKLILFLVLGCIITYIIKPMNVYNIYIDSKTGEIKKQLIFIKFISFSVLFSIILYFLITKLSSNSLLRHQGSS